MSEVYTKETGGEQITVPTTKPTTRLFGWKTYGRSRFPVIWDHSSKRWLTTTDLTAMDRSDDLWSLRTMDDPNWGKPWHWGEGRNPPPNI